MPALVVSAIRTGAPMLTGWLLSLPAAPVLLRLLGVNSEHAAEMVTGAVVVVLGWAWYVAVRAAEHRWPRLGVLLGVPRPPAYPPTAAGPLLRGPHGEWLTAAPVPPGQRE